MGRRLQADSDSASANSASVNGTQAGSMPSLRKGSVFDRQDVRDPLVFAQNVSAWVTYWVHPVTLITSV